MSEIEVTPLRAENMTSRQLVRRAKLIEAVIDLVRDVGAPAVQMREVAERSGVAMGTLYRYFRSKDHLLAVALAEWQQRLIRRVLSSYRPENGTAAEQVAEYLTRALAAFHRNHQMAQLMVQSTTSTDPDVIASLDRMNAANNEVWSRLLATVPPADLPYVQTALDSVLMTAVTRIVTRRASVEETNDILLGVVRILLENR